MRHLALAHCAAAYGEHGDRLRRIDGAAAAERDHTVMRRFGDKAARRLDRCDRGVGNNVAIGARRYPRVGEDRPQPVERAVLRQEGVGQDRRSGEAELGERRRQLGDRAAADADRPRQEDRGHGYAPSRCSVRTGPAVRAARRAAFRAPASRARR